MKLQILGSKTKVALAQSLTLLLLAVFIISNFIFIMHLGRPSADFANSTIDNYVIIYLIKTGFQLLLLTLSGWFLYIFYSNRKSKFTNVKWYLKLGVAVVVIFFNMPSIYNLSLIPAYTRGVKVKSLSEFSLYTKRFDHGRRSVSYSYRNFVTIDNKAYEISDTIYSKLECPKGETGTLWTKTCKQEYTFYYLEFEEGLLDVKR